MKKCLNCNISVGGNVKSCPLCRNSLTGEDSYDNWPQLNKLRAQALFYKLQLFVALSIVIIALALDFLMDLNNGKHYSLMIAIGIIIVEVVVRGFIKKSLVITKIINISMLHIAIILLVVAWYYGFQRFVLEWILPVLMGVTLIADFIFALIDKTQNAMVYLLVSILTAMVAYVVIAVEWGMKPFVWSITLIISLVSLVGIMVFKGPKVISEIQKRMNF